MKTQLTGVIIALALLASLHRAAAPAIIGTAFTYQGRLNNNGNPANGSYDLSFSLYVGSSGGVAAFGPLTNSATGVSNGLFTVTLDFGSGVFNGLPYWLDISVRTNGNGAFAELSPRQQLTPVPYAVFSESAGTAATANGVAAGSVTAADIASGQVVKSLNGFEDAVTLSPGANVTITPSGNTLTIASTGGGGGSGWSLTGNSNTIPGVNFLGTADNEPLELWVNGGRAFRLEPTASGPPNVIGGWTDNSVDAGLRGVTIGGGYNNTVKGPYGLSATVGGGLGNSAAGLGSTVAGGGGNVASGLSIYNSVGGGNANTAGSNYTTVAGGYRNSASGSGATVGGGEQNAALGDGSFVGGGGYDGSTIAGNTAKFPGSTAVAGLGNTAFGYYATVVGGHGNVAQNSASFVGGGQNNSATYDYAVIGGGLNNYAGYSAFVGGGQANQATGQGSVIGGGGYDGFATSGNTADGGGSTVPGGVGNSAAGNYSFAAGHNAQALHQGSFVWADNLGTPFASTANNQFNVRADNGVRFVTGGNGLSGMTLDGYQVLTTASGGGGGGGGITNAWLLTGNYNANPASGNFLGTADTNALELHVDSLRGFRLDHAFDPTASESININGGYWGNTIADGVAGATIAGGGDVFHLGINQTAEANSVTGSLGTVGGGHLNTAGPESTVPGGYNNSATGRGSFAAGRNAQTTYDGSFVWGDGTRAATGTGANRFDVLATGGVYLWTESGGVSSDSTRGFSLGAANQPLITRAFDVFGGGAGGSKAGLGRWGLFMEPERLVLGIPGDDVPGRYFVVGKYDTSGNFIPLTTVSQNGNLACNSLTILGGSDLAEPFQISTADTEVAQGAVLVIDEDNPGHLKLSEQPYDARVAGIVSGANGINPGIQMQQQGILEGGKNVALSGRVYVQADVSNGPIKPGDLLTSSTIPGHAMRVSDHSRAQGAILGKAMTALKDGNGMVLVLVTLQ